MVLESGFLTHSINFIYGLFTEKNSLRFRHFSIFHSNFQQTIAQPTIRLPIEQKLICVIDLTPLTTKFWIKVFSARIINGFFIAYLEIIDLISFNIATELIIFHMLYIAFHCKYNFKLSQRVFFKHLGN